MHGIYLAQQILEAVLKKVPQNKAKSIKKIEIILDQNDHLTTNDLKFNLQNLAKETLAKKAEIKISKTGDKTYIKNIVLEVI